MTTAHHSIVPHTLSDPTHQGSDRHEDAKDIDPARVSIKGSKFRNRIVLERIPPGFLHRSLEDRFDHVVCEVESRIG